MLGLRLKFKMPQYPAPASLSMLYILIRKFIDAATKSISQQQKAQRLQTERV